MAASSQLTGCLLYRELRELGYGGGYTILTDLLREIRPKEVSPFERFETPPGRQARADFAHFRTVFAGEQGVERIIRLFSLVPGRSRMPLGRFVLSGSSNVATLSRRRIRGACGRAGANPL